MRQKAKELVHAAILTCIVIGVLAVALFLTQVAGAVGMLILVALAIYLFITKGYKYNDSKPE